MDQTGLKPYATGRIERYICEKCFADNPLIPSKFNYDEQNTVVSVEYECYKCKDKKITKR